MRLTSIGLRDFRSLSANGDGRLVRLDLAPGQNALVGRNNCGKSNVLRALELALDPTVAYQPDRDAPVTRPFAHPEIVLRFACDSEREGDARVLDAVAAYEREMKSDRGPTSTQEVTLRVAFRPVAEGGIERQSSLVIASENDMDTPARRRLHEDAIAAVQDVVGFVMIRSGESLQSVLEGNFRQILHRVVRDLDVFAAAEDSRAQYVAGLQEQLLDPLRQRLQADVGALFAEVEAVTLDPEVLSIDRTLSRVEINLTDAVSTPLLDKGTGLRGAVLVAMLRYLGEQAGGSVVMAVEEPEAFLHPAAQEQLRDHLDDLAASKSVSLVVTTHSPFIVTRSPSGAIFRLTKDTSGVTQVTQRARGDEPHAPLVGDLLRPTTFEEVIKAARSVPDGTQAVLLVEGQGDIEYLRLAAERAGRTELLDGIHLIPTGGTTQMPVQAVVTRAATDVPVIALVDNDEPGKKARKHLTDTLKFQGQTVLTCAELFPKAQRNFPYEAEDLFDTELISGFVETQGGPQAARISMRFRPDDAAHFDLDEDQKTLLGAYLDERCTGAHVTRWIELLELVRERSGLAAAAPASPPQPSPPTEGVVLVLAGDDTDDHHHTRYLQSGVIHREVSDEITHLAFYRSGGIEPEVPRILGRYPGLVHDKETVAHLRRTGRRADGYAADHIEVALERGLVDEGAVDDLIVLSRRTDAETVLLTARIPNTKTSRDGRLLAWSIRPRRIPLHLLRSGPADTTQLDDLIAAEDR